MIPFISAGLVSMLGVVMGKRLARRHTRQEKTRSALSVQILAHRVLGEETLILATEDVPMDNRFGNKPLGSEHEFHQTATVSLDLGDSRRITATAKSTLWNLLENRAELELGKSLGIEVGSQVSRRVRLRFATDPGQFVRYRVVWTQQSQRGVLEIQAGRHIFQVPYLVAYGLSHTVESLPGESIAKPDKKTGDTKEEEE